MAISSLFKLKTWFDLRAIFVALLLAVAASLPYITTSIIRRDYYFFDITLTSTTPGTTQVFWDLGRGYNENDSSRQPLKIEPTPVVYRYMMPMGDIKSLRFDPVDGVGVFNLSHAQIVDFKGKIVRTFSPADFKPFSDIARTEIRGDTLFVETKQGGGDPVFELTLHTPLHLASNRHIWLIEGMPVALPVFLIGLLIGCPLFATFVHRHAARLGYWLQQRPCTAIALTAVVTVAVQCHPVIFFGRSFASPNNGALMLYGELPTLPGSKEYMYTNGMSSDTGALLFQHLYYPMVQNEALRHGELPLWNRYSLCGEPLLGQGQSMFGDPFNFITLFADGAAWAWDVRFLLAHWLLAAGLGFIVWRLTRHLGSALLTTLGSTFIAFFTFRLVHPANFSVCYSPWILLAWIGLIYAGSRRAQVGWLAALVLANWTVMTSGTMKEAYMLIACLNLAGICQLLLLPVTQGRRLRLFGLATFAGLCFILLSAPGWMSFLVAWKHSFTGYDVPFANALPVTQLIGLFDDMFYRQTTPDEAVVAPALNFLFLLGAFWWLVQPRLWRTDHAGMALALASTLPLALAFGLVPQGIILRIPFIANIGHIGNTFSCVLLTLVAVLAGCGFKDAFQRARDSGWWWIFFRMVAIGGLLTACFYLTTQKQAKSPFFSGYIPALAIATVVLPICLRWYAKTTARPGPLLVAVGLGLPIVLARHCQYDESFFNHYAFVPGYRSDLHAPSPAVAFVDHRQTEPGRVVGWGNNLFPSYNTALRWESLYGVDAVRSLYYQELAINFGLQRVWVWDWYNEEKKAAALVPAHDLLNVTHYVETHGKQPLAIAGLDLLGRLDLDIYQSPTAWPRAFFTDRLATYATPRDFAAMIRDGDRRPFAAVQAGEKEAVPVSASLENRTVHPAVNYRLTPNTTRFTVEASGPGVAVLTETYYADDFQVTINGKAATYFRVNHAFKGVSIPSAGRYEVSFSYWPQYFSLALALAAVGAALFIAGLVLFLRFGPNPVVATPPIPA